MSNCNSNGKFILQNERSELILESVYINGDKGDKGDTGLSSFELWKTNYGSQHPEIQTVQQWIDSGYGGMNTYTQFEI